MTLCFFDPTEDTLSSGLTRQLETLDGWLREHQLAFMERRWREGILLYEKVYELRRYHLDFMESELLPRFEDRYPKPPHGARPGYFRREKKLIIKTMRPYAHLFGRLYLREAMEELSLPRLFDEYMYLKDLLDHHDAREKGFLFRMLDEALSRETVGTLLINYARGVEQREARWL